MTPSIPQSPAATPSTAPASPKAKPRRRWLVRLLLLMVCSLAIAVWFAPQIVAETSLKQQLPKLLFPLYPGHVEIGSASLGWLQPVVVRNLRAEDAQGHLFLDVKEFSTSEPLWKLIVGKSSLGRLKLDEPQISIEFRPNGSNVEDVVASLLSGPRSSARPADFELEINNATVVLGHRTASLTSLIKPCSLILQSKRGTIEELELTMGPVPSKDDAAAEPTTDWLAFRYGSQPTQDGVAMTSGSKHLRLKAAGWTLDKLLPALARIEPNAELAGAIDADTRSQINVADAPANWSDREWSCDGRITVKKFVLAGIAALKQDRVTLETTSLAGRLAVQQGRLSMDRAQLLTEVGELTATGDMPLKGLTTASPFDALSSILGEQDYTIHGHLDLQRLAALLPNTLRVRDGTQITSGRVEVNLKSEDQQGSRSWTADATLDQLAATNRGQKIAWNEPLRLNMQAHRLQNVTTIDQVTCQSDFFKLAGQGTLTDAKFTASADLPRLEEHLQKFIDLGLDQLTGTAKAQGEIRRLEKDQVSLTAAVQLDGFKWNLSKGTVWQESRLVLSVNADGTTVSDSSLKRLESAELKLTSGQDTLVASLQKGVDLDSKTAAWPVKATAEGDLRTWQNRLSPFIGLNGWQLGGVAKIAASVTVDPKQIEVASLTGNVITLDVRGPEWWIKEPQVNLDTAGIWSIEHREWSSPQTTLTGTAIALRVNELLVDLKQDGQLERLTGTAAYRGDLDKLSRWKNQALQRPSYHFMGTFEGQAHLAEQDSSISLDLDTTVKKLVVGDLETLPTQQLEWVALWREPELRIIGKGSYDIAADELQMETASVKTDGLSVNLNGTLAQLSSAQHVDLKGELGYDWQIVGQRMGEPMRKSLQMTGKQTRPLAFKGTLASLTSPSAGQAIDLSGNAGIGWDSAVLEGLAVGSTDVSAHLEQGVCQFAPINTTIADGQLHLTPQIRFDRNPALIVLPAEKVLDQVQISPQLCNTWLKFVVPLLADATEIDGKFSLEITGGALPMSAPMTGELGGSLAVHHVQVRPGAGALQVVNLIDQIQSLIQQKPAGNPRDRVLMEMPEHAIPIKLTGGRMYHQNVTLVIGGTTVKSSGSVGRDETIDLVLLVGIKDEWTQDNKLLAGLKGQALKVPVSGTLSRPVIDSRILTELATQIGGTALQGVLEDKVDDLFKKKLNKFLPGKN